MVVETCLNLFNLLRFHRTNSITLSGNHFSIATQFDICEEEWKLELTSGIFFVGWAIGALLFGWICDRFGRKIVLFPSIAGIQLICFISAFMPNVYLVILCRLLIGILIPATLVQPVILITELVGSKYDIYLYRFKSIIALFR